MDSAGLSAAYASATGMHQYTGSDGQQVLAIRGTDWAHGAGQLARDIRDDMMLPYSGVAGIGGVRNTQKYAQAKRYLDHHPEVDEIVGHSLGASVAEALGQDYNKTIRVYGSPSVTWARNPRHRRHYLDPVSLLDRGATHTLPGFNPHAAP